MSRRTLLEMLLGLPFIKSLVGWRETTKGRRKFNYYEFNEYVCDKCGQDSQIGKCFTRIARPANAGDRDKSNHTAFGLCSDCTAKIHKSMCFARRMGFITGYNIQPRSVSEVDHWA